MSLVKFSTSVGDFTLSLNADKAPKTVANFLNYVESKFYSDTIFHRVIDGFMVQGGGMTADMSQKKTEAPIENEAANGLKNKKYTVAMARTGDPHSATAQFFINVSDNDFLDFKNANAQGFGYCVFGEVIEGKEVIDAMRAVKTTRVGGHQDVPKTAIVIQQAQVISA